MEFVRFIYDHWMETTLFMMLAIAFAGAFSVRIVRTIKDDDK